MVFKIPILFKRERIFKKCGGQFLRSDFPFLRKGDTFGIMIGPGKFIVKKDDDEEMVAASNFMKTVKGEECIDIVGYGRYMIKKGGDAIA